MPVTAVKLKDRLVEISADGGDLDSTLEAVAALRVVDVNGKLMAFVLESMGRGVAQIAARVKHFS